MPGDLSWMQARYDELAERSLLWEPPTLEGPSVPRCRMDGKPTIMLSANNYLNLTTHPKVVDAAVEATKTYGAGSGSVRAIAGTMDLHLEAEKEVAAFKRAEAALIYSAGYTANVGLIPSLVRGSEDLIISDELNHGSIIDGVRLTKASRAVYAHNDMGALEEVLIANKGAERKLIITDGVFSMDGDIAPLDEIVALAEEHDAMIMVDDCHGEGVLGEGGRGIVDHFNVHGKVEFELGSFSKALGVQGASWRVLNSPANTRSTTPALGCSPAHNPRCRRGPAGGHSGAEGRTGTPPALVGQHRVFPRGTPASVSIRASRKRRSFPSCAAHQRPPRPSRLRSLTKASWPVQSSSRWWRATRPVSAPRCRRGYARRPR